MTLNHSKTIKILYPYCAFPFWNGIYSRDTTVLIDLVSYTTPASLTTFLPTMIVENLYLYVPY